MKPTPIWKRWMKDPEKREKMYIVFFIINIIINLMIVAGFILFIVFLVKSRS